MIHRLRSAYLLYGWFVYSDSHTYVNLCPREQEYEEQTTPEARFVKGRQDLIMDKCSLTRYADLDRIEMALQGSYIGSYNWNCNAI
jgi:hypothetical protein